MRLMSTGCRNDSPGQLWSRAETFRWFRLVNPHLTNCRISHVLEVHKCSWPPDCRISHVLEIHKCSWPPNCRISHVLEVHKCSWPPDCRISHVLEIHKCSWPPDYRISHVLEVQEHLLEEPSQSPCLFEGGPCQLGVWRESDVYKTVLIPKYGSFLITKFHDTVEVKALSVFPIQRQRYVKRHHNFWHIIDFGIDQRTVSLHCSYCLVM